MPDTQLLKDAARGDRRAQFQLYQRCYSVLMGVCVRYRDSEEEAAAMLNEGYLKVVRNLEKYNREMPFEAWIRRIMINTLIDDFRKNRKVSELIEHHDFSDTSDHAHLVAFNLAEMAFEAEELVAMIKTLPPVSQKVFNLFAIDGYSHREIGELLAMSEGTSKWHFSFARQRLRDLLTKKEGAVYAKESPDAK
jgi:RNA polymerase sigma factor (sigma-70 family)